MDRRVSNSQLNALLDILQENPTLVRGVGLGPRSKEAIDQKWQEIANILNAHGSGSSKSDQHWKRLNALLDILQENPTLVRGVGLGPRSKEAIDQKWQEIANILNAHGSGSSKSDQHWKRLNALLDILQENPTLVRGVGLGPRSKEAIDQKWQEIANILNAHGSGSSKSDQHWKRLNALLDILQENPTLVRGVGLGPRSKEAIDQKWQEIANILNAHGSGSSKSDQHWKRLNALLDILQENPTLVRGVGLGPRSKEAIDQKWQEIANILNAHGSGSSKSDQHWKRLNALLDILQENPTLVRGVGLGPRSKEAIDQKWQEIANILNAHGSGSSKSDQHWKRLNALLDILQENPTLVRGVGLGPRSKEAIDQKWQEIANILNAHGSGSSKSDQHWKRICFNAPGSKPQKDFERTFQKPKMSV
nr:unnamed protein product [Callosobruchus chinensis]